MRLRGQEMLQAGASSSLGQSLKKKLMQSKTMTTTTITKTTVMELQQKEKKVYYLPGQKHDPPEDVRVEIDFSSFNSTSCFFHCLSFWYTDYGCV